MPYVHVHAYIHVYSVHVHNVHALICDKITCGMSTYFSQSWNPLPSNSAAEQRRLECSGALEWGFSSSMPWRVLAVCRAMWGSMTSAWCAVVPPPFSAPLWWWWCSCFSSLNSAPIIPRIISAVVCCCWVGTGPIASASKSSTKCLTFALSLIEVLMVGGKWSFSAHILTSSRRPGALIRLSSAWRRAWAASRIWGRT